MLIGAIIGALVGGRPADALGRKRTLILLATVFAVGAILSTLAPNFGWFIAWRILVGIGVGGGSVAVPMYTTELAPSALRGRMVFLFQLALTGGIAVAYWVDLWFANAGWGWRPMFGMAIVPALLLGAGMLALPDTQRWLAGKGP